MRWPAIVLFPLVLFTALCGVATMLFLLRNRDGER
jgi:hypothetical protein